MLLSINLANAYKSLKANKQTDELNYFLFIFNIFPGVGGAGQREHQRSVEQRAAEGAGVQAERGLLLVAAAGGVHRHHVHRRRAAVQRPQGHSCRLVGLSIVKLKES